MLGRQGHATRDQQRALQRSGEAVRSRQERACKLVKNSAAGWEQFWGGLGAEQSAEAVQHRVQ